MDRAERVSGEDVFAKTPFPHPSAKNSYMAGGTTNADVRRDRRSPFSFPLFKGGCRGILAAVATGIPAGSTVFPENFSLGSFLVAWFLLKWLGRQEWLVPSYSLILPRSCHEHLTYIISYDERSGSVFDFGPAAVGQVSYSVSSLDEALVEAAWRVPGASQDTFGQRG